MPGDLTSSTRAAPRARTSTVLLASTAALSASSSVVFALMGNLQDEYGFADLGLGVIAAMGFAVSFLVQIFVAPLADKGHPKHLLLGATVLAVVGNVMFALGSSLWQFALARAIIGAAVGMFLPPARALMANLAETGAAERLGKMAGAELGGFVFGPVVGGLLVGPLGLRWPFLVFCVAAVASFALLVGEKLPALPVTTSSGRLAFDLLGNRRVLIGVLLLLSLALPVGMYDALWDRYLTDNGASDVVVGLSLAVYGLPFILLARFGGRLADRYGPSRVAFRALLLIAPLTAAYGIFHNPWAPIAVGIVESIAQAAASPSAQATLAAAAPEGRGTAAQGLAGAMNVLAAACVAMLASWAYGAFGPTWVFAIAGASVALCGLTAWRLDRGLRARETALSPATADAA